MRRVFFPVLAFAFVISLAWYAGVDFTIRGFWPSYSVGVASMAAYFVWIWQRIGK